MNLCANPTTADYVKWFATFQVWYTFSFAEQPEAFCIKTYSYLILRNKKVEKLGNQNKY
jgi:hypothetical protein